jgi:hypothetical protein
VSFGAKQYLLPIANLQIYACGRPRFREIRTPCSWWAFIICALRELSLPLPSIKAEICDLS